MVKLGTFGSFSLQLWEQVGTPAEFGPTLQFTRLPALGCRVRLVGYQTSAVDGTIQACSLVLLTNVSSCRWRSPSAGTPIEDPVWDKGEFMIAHAPCWKKGPWVGRVVSPRSLLSSVMWERC